VGFQYLVIILDLRRYGPGSILERLTRFTLAEAFHGEVSTMAPEVPRRCLAAERSQARCAHVLRLTAAQADTSLMPNSTASCW